MGITYDDRLKEEFCRRNLALERMRMACTATKQTITEEAAGFKEDLKDLKEDMKPRNVVRRNPWYSMLGALVAGGAVAVLARKLVTPAEPEQVSMSREPQRVVVEVKGAKESPSPAPKRSSTSGWKEIFDAAMHGIPAVAAFVEQHMSKSSPHNGGSSPDKERSEASATVGVGDKGPAPFKAFISRRSAPPPRES